MTTINTQGLDTITQPNTTDKSTELTPERLPCTIHHNGLANTDVFFIVHSSENEDNQYSASFRGRELTGKYIKNPSTSTGVIFKESDASGITGDREWNAEHTFQQIRVWNHDRTPNTASMDWFDISSAIHAPVSKEEMENVTLN